MKLCYIFIFLAIYNIGASQVNYPRSDVLVPKNENSVKPFIPEPVYFETTIKIKITKEKYKEYRNRNVGIDSIASSLIQNYDFTKKGKNNLNKKNMEFNDSIITNIYFDGLTEKISGEKEAGREDFEPGRADNVDVSFPMVPYDDSTLSKYLDYLNNNLGEIIKIYTTRNAWENYKLSEKNSELTVYQQILLRLNLVNQFKK